MQRVLAARVAWQAIKLSQELDELGYLRCKSGRLYRRTVTECEFSCYEPAVVELSCRHIGDVDDSDFDDFNPGRAACVHHKNIKKIRCDCAGSRGCLVVDRRPLSESEMSDTFDEDAAFECVRRALIGDWGQFGPLMSAYVQLKEIPVVNEFSAVSESVVPSFVEGVMFGSIPACCVDVVSFITQSPKILTKYWSPEPLLVDSSLVDPYLAPETSLGVVELKGVGLNELISPECRGQLPVTNLKSNRKRFYHQSGYCYLYLFPYRMRPSVRKSLKRYPLLEDIVVEIWSRGFNVAYRGQKLYFNSHHHASVRKAAAGQLVWQLPLASHVSPKSVVGGEVPPDVSVCFICGSRDCDNCLAAFNETPLGVVDESVKTSDPVSERDGRINVMVKGSGDCWKKSPIYRTWLSDPIGEIFSESMPMSRFLYYVQVMEGQNDEFGDNWGMKSNPKHTFSMTLMDDGDYHLELHFQDTSHRRWKPFCQFVKKLPQFRDLDGVEDDRLVGSSNVATSALDNAINMLRSPENQNQAEGFTFPWLGDSAKKIQEECPWEIKPESRELAVKLALNWTTRASDPHSHPIHAALRRRSYAQAVPYWRGPTTIMFMKPDNYRFLQRQYSDLDLTLRNHIFEVKDIARYCSDQESLGTNVFNFPKCDTPVAHWDEAGHYKRTEAVAHYFHDNPELRVLTVSHVFPIESLQSTRPSDPKNASWRRLGDELVYLPENDEQNPYFQPAVPQLLMARTVRCDDLDVMLFGAIVWKGFNTYLQVWTRYRMDVPRFLPVDHEKMMFMPKLLRAQPKADPIPVRWWVDVYMYLKTIKGPTDKDVWAKLRQIVKKDITVDTRTMDVFVAVALKAATMEFKYDSYLSKHYDNFFSKIKYNTVDRLRKSVHAGFRTKYHNRWNELINDPNPIGLLPLHNAVLTASSAKPDSGYVNHWEIDEAERANFLDFFKNIWNFMAGGDTKAVADLTVDHTGVVHVGGAKFVNMTPSHKRKFGLPRQAVMDLQSQDFRRKLLDDFAEERAEALLEGERRDHELWQDLPVVKPAAKVVFKGREKVAVEEKSGLVVSEEKVEEKGKTLQAETGVVPVVNPFAANYVPLKWHVNDKGVLVPMISEVKIDKPVEQLLDKLPDELVEPELPINETREDQVLTFAERMLEKKPWLRQPQISNNPFLKLQTGEHVNEYQSLVEVTTSVPVKNITKDMTKEEVAQPEVTQLSLSPQSTGESLCADATSNKSLWENYKRSILRPARPQIKGDIRGVMLWDALYPLTMGRRLQSVPFRDVTYCPDVAYPTQDCLLEALNKIYGVSKIELFADVVKVFPRSQVATIDGGMTEENLWSVCLARLWQVEVRFNGERRKVGVRDALPFVLELKDGHWKTHVPKRKPMVFPRDLAPFSNGGVHGRLINELTTLPTINFKPWTPEFARAQELIRAMWNGTTGLIGSSSEGKQSLKSVEALLENRPVVGRYLAIINGDPGCRKSSSVQRILAKHEYHKNDAFKVVCPTNTLRADWAAKLDVMTKKGYPPRATPAWYVTTFETALINQHAAKVVVLDEHKFSKGYMAFLALRFPNSSHFVFLGDPHQSQKHEVNPDCHLNNPEYSGEGEFYAPYADYFIVGTWRYDGVIANILRQPAYASLTRKHNSKMWFAESWFTSHVDLAKIYPKKTEQELLEIWKDTLTMVPGEADILASHSLNLNDVVTYAGSQGLTSKLGQLIITPNAIKACDLRMIYTAMTRSEDLLVVVPLYNAESKRAATINPLLDCLLNKYKPHFGNLKPVSFMPEWSVDVKASLGCLSDKTKLVCAGPPEKCVNWDDVKQHYPKDFEKVFVDPDRVVKRGGHQILQRDDPAYVDAPNFLVHVDLPPPVDVREEEVREAVARTSVLRTHLLKGDERALDELTESKVEERFQRELTWKGLFSEQMPDGYLTRADGAKILDKWVRDKGRGAMRKKAISDFLATSRAKADSENPFKYSSKYINWGQLQMSSDNASFRAGVEQRIRRVDYAGNVEDLRSTVTYGAELFSQLKTYMGWDRAIPWDPVLYEECQTIFSARRAERSQGLKKASLNRSEPDYVDLLTAKSQLKLKEHDPPVAKPLQTILIKSDEYLFKLGAVGVYLLKVIQKFKPESCYLHAGKSLEEFFNWFAKNDPKSGIYVGIDIKGYDGTQRGASLNFELMLMEHFGVPEDLITFYKEDKLDAHTRTIMIGLMRLSGELFTWLFNTMFQLARTVTKYAVPPKDALAVSGDDIELFRELLERPTWRNFENVDVCEEKIERGSRGSFCSWLVKDGHVFKDPQILFMRLRAAISRGKLDDIVDGYFLEFKSLFALGDLNVALLEENEQEYVNYLSNFFHNVHRTLGLRKKLDFSTVSVEVNPERGAQLEYLVETLNEILEAPAATVVNFGVAFVDALG